jgi:hypothetical protein
LQAQLVGILHVTVLYEKQSKTIASTSLYVFLTHEYIGLMDVIGLDKAFNSNTSEL